MTTLGEKLLVALAGTILLSFTVVWDARTTIIRTGPAPFRIDPCAAHDAYAGDSHYRPSPSCRNR
ncbi:MAG: hypothetical protein AB7G68_07740 [Nitrospiraceae bacterium]